MKFKPYILIALLVILLTGCTSPLIKSDNISKVSVYASPFLSRLTDVTLIHNTDGLSPFIPLLNQGLKNNKKVETDVVGDVTIELEMTNSTTRKFLLDFNIPEKEILIKENEQTYLLDTETAVSFLNTAYFKSLLHIVYPVPELSLRNANQDLSYSAQGEMKYDSFRKTIYTEKIAIDKTDELPEINSETGLTTVAFKNTPTKIIEKLYKDGELIDSFEVYNTDLLMPLHEGLYTMELDCTWEKNHTEFMEGQVVYSFDFYYNMPSQITLSEHALQPGGLVFVNVDNVKDLDTITVDTTLSKNNIVFFPKENGFFGIIPLAGSLSPMDYPVKVEVSEDHTILEDTFTVLNREYPIQNLQVSSSTLSLRTRENIKKNNETLSNSRKITGSSPTILWHEPFIKPVEGTITTEYYHIRYTNGNPNPRRHVGIDIAAPYDTPILATNTGKVVVAEEMVLTGNTLIIDHGCGLFSMYAHLNAMNYAPDDEINRGDILGLMGSTGFSTGSHLHFEMYYNGAYVDPAYFYDHDPYIECLIK